ncbi:hypothetical protein H8356DRAFT_1358676 [Neocallimastix lanati (nom. inval.)]|nr:hypothetical protein H8356DRAFT_1358676 [Neocallimastix sp. JGI-2020a]
MNRDHFYQKYLSKQVTSSKYLSEDSISVDSLCKKNDYCYLTGNRDSSLPYRFNVESFDCEVAGKAIREANCIYGTLGPELFNRSSFKCLCSSVLNCSSSRTKVPPPRGNIKIYSLIFLIFHNRKIVE